LAMAPSTPAAVTQLTECSLERPPNRTATRGREDGVPEGFWLDDGWSVTTVARFRI
jgi:hypothetical protein